MDRELSLRARLTPEALWQFVEHSTDVLSVQDATSHWLYLSPAARDVLGHDPASLVGHSPFEFIHPEDLCASHERRTRLLGGEPCPALRLRFRRDDGSYTWVEVSNSVIRDEAGHVAGIHANVRDVNRQVELERTLAHRQRELEAAQRLASVGSWEWNPVTGEVLWSEELFRMFGDDPSQPPPTLSELLDRAVPETAAAFRTAIARTLDTGEPYDFEVERRVPHGARWVAIRGEAVRDPAGRITGLRGTVMDITATKQAERALRRHEAEFEEAQRIAAIGSWDWFPETDTLAMSPMMYRLVARKPEQGSPARAERQRHYTPDSWAKLRRVVRRTLDTGDPYELDLEVVREDGEHRWMTARGEAVYDVAGKLLHLRGTLQDITERVTAEAALRESEERYRSVVNSMAEGVMLMDMDATVVAVSKRAADILGLSIDQALGRSLRDPRWRTMFEDGTPFPPHEFPAMRTLRTGETCSDVIMGLRLPDDTERWISINSEPLLLNGTISGVVCSFIDITEKRAAREQAREQAQFTELMVRIVGQLARAGADTVDEAIVDALRAFAAFVRVDHAFIALLLDAGLHYGVSHEWCAAGVEPIAHRYQWVPVGESARHTLNDEPIVWQTLADVPAARERTVLEQEGARSVLRVPLGGADGVRGAVVLHQHREVRPWAAHDELRARMVAGSIAGVLDRVRSERARRQSEERYRLIADNTEDVIWLYNLSDHRLEYVSPSVERLAGVPVAEAIRRPLRDLIEPATFDALMHTLRERVRAVERGDASARVSTHLVDTKRADGSLVPTEVVATLIQNAAGAVTHVQGVSRDISRRQMLEQQLIQAQKLESIGRLAGGVAHDFNNMLGVIVGQVELALEDLGDQGGSVAVALEEISSAAHRSANLTRQLLAFARRQTIAPKILNLNEAVSGMLTMLRRLIGEDVTLDWQPDATLWPAKIDPTQLDQVLANIAVNARDAMAGTGHLSISTRNLVVDEALAARHVDVTPGEYVELRVADTGVGIAPEVLEHVFEPFFTTKESGKGTGLGLSTVYGIVRQNGGFVYAESQVGAGTTFRIWLPRREAGRQETTSKRVPAPAGSGTVLVVEDERAILNLATIVLTRLGYEVLSAATPAAAVALFEQRDGHIDLVISDVVMPEMNGLELIERLQARNPQIKHLFISGYTADIVEQRGGLSDGMRMLQKPFTTAALGQAVRDALLDR
jgi:PAS domain S-box-containing protein